MHAFCICIMYDSRLQQLQATYYFSAGAVLPLNITDTFGKLNISTPSCNYSDMPNYFADIKKKSNTFLKAILRAN